MGDIKRCTTGNPNRVSNPIFTLNEVPEGTVELRFRMIDRNAPGYNHGGGKIKNYSGETTINPGAFRPKFGYDFDDNGYLVPCEKEQSIIRLMKILRKKGNSYKKISEVVTKSTRKKFPQSWVFNILKRESSIPPNEEIIRHNICNVELQPNILDV